MVIISSISDDGSHRASPAELCEQVLEVAPEAVCTIVKGPITGIRVDDAVAVKWLMRTYTAAGRRRRER